tara:strand:+ start:333 stop:563 length:231 start_codon:yes stop_codon:yes gene_type:complete
MNNIVQDSIYLKNIDQIISILIESLEQTNPRIKNKRIRRSTKIRDPKLLISSVGGSGHIYEAIRVLEHLKEAYQDD